MAATLVSGSKSSGALTSAKGGGGGGGGGSTTTSSTSSLTTTQLAALTSTTIAAWSTSQIAALSSTQIGYLTTSQLSGLKSTQIAAITTSAIKGLTTYEMAALTTAQFAGLKSTQIAALSTSQIASISATDIAAMTSTQLAGLSSADIAAMTTNEIASLSTANIAALSTTQVKGLTSTELGALGTAQFARLSSAQIAALAPASLSGLTSAELSALTTTQLAGMTATEIGSLSSSQITSLSSADIAALTATQIKGLTSAELGALTPAQFSQLSSAQIAALTSTAFAGLTSTEWSAMTATQIAGLTATEIAGLSQTQIAGLTTAQIAALTTTQISGLTTTELAELTSAQFAALGAAQIGALSTTDIASLSTASISGMTATQIAGLTAAEIAALSATQLGSIHLDYNAMLTILNNDAVGGMSTAKLASLKALAAKMNVTGGIAVSSYLEYITDAVVNGNAANTTWTGGAAKSVTLGNLTATSTQTQVTELIGKWFLGTDLPSSSVNMSGASPFTVTYTAVSNALWGANGPSMYDINQGYLGDCFFLSTLAEVAYMDPAAIESMITYDGNNTYGVCFSVGGQDEYVTVTNKLADGGTLFNTGSYIWASIVEEAYAELQAGGAVTGNTYTGNTFTSIANGGSPECALEEVTGASTITDFDAAGSTWTQYVLNGADLSQPNSAGFVTQSSQAGLSTAAVQAMLIDDLNAGDYLILSSNTDATDQNGVVTLVSDHALAIYGYDANTGMFEIYNPWGTEASGQYWNTTFEESLSTLLAAGDTISVASGSSSLTSAVSSAVTTAAATVASTVTTAVATSAPTLKSIIAEWKHGDHSFAQLASLFASASASLTPSSAPPPWAGGTGEAHQSPLWHLAAARS